MSVCVFVCLYVLYGVLSRWSAVVLGRVKLTMCVTVCLCYSVLSRWSIGVIPVSHLSAVLQVNNDEDDRQQSNQVGVRRMSCSAGPC